MKRLTQERVMRVRFDLPKRHWGRSLAPPSLPVGLCRSGSGTTPPPRSTQPSQGIFGSSTTGGGDSLRAGCTSRTISRASRSPAHGPRDQCRSSLRFGLVGAVRPRPYTDDKIRRVAASLWKPLVIEKAWFDAQERARRAGGLDDLR